jgi:ribosomal protein S18 acetylase RimI-like enzyme
MVSVLSIGQITIHHDELMKSAGSWISAASNPYLGKLCNPYIDPYYLVKQRMVCKSSEYFLGRARVLVDDAGKPIGGYIAMSGFEVIRCRRSDMIALSRLLPIEALRRFIVETKTLFAPIGKDAFYLSKIGLQPDFVGRGFGRILLSDWIAQASHVNCDFLQLDVPAENLRAIALYEASGFRCIHRGECENLDLKYLTMRRDR